MTVPRRPSNRPPANRAGHTAPVPIDPITLGVIWGALQSIAVEIGTTVHKTAYSEQAREGQDFSVAVFDARGRMVAQGPYSPGHMGAMSFAVRNALAAHPVETLKPGDAILLNDPLLGSGHLPDFFITQPAFHRGELIGFAVNILHHTDVGGARPGSQAVEGIFDFFQEGLRILPTKVWEDYREHAGITGIIAANTRTPDKVLGDLRAQRSALRVGELRLTELAERGRAAADYGEGARGLVPESAPARGRRPARDHLLSHVRGGHRRPGPRAARARGGGGLALRQPDLRRLGPRAPAPLRRLRAGALGHGRARQQRRLRGDVVRIQRLQHPRRGPGGEPADRRRALRVHPRLGRAGQVPRRLRHPARPALPGRRGPADESLRASAVRAVRALRRPARGPRHA